MSGKQIVDRWNYKEGGRIFADGSDRNRLNYVRECLLLAGGDEGAPIEAIVRRAVVRLLEAEGKLHDIHLTITNTMPAR